jgi:hypothetical protein
MLADWHESKFGRHDMVCRLSRTEAAPWGDAASVS